MKFTQSLSVFVCLMFTTVSHAHVGIMNDTLPITAAGQAAFTVANTTSVIEFIVSHGCNDEAEPTPPKNLDTTQIQITVPAEIVAATTAASLRPSHQGEFSQASRETLEDGAIRFTWTKKQAAASSDEEFYKVAIRLKTPKISDENDIAIKKYQFLTTQICAIDNETNYVLNWGEESPSLLSFPEKRKGFNQYTLHSSTLSDFNVSGSGTKAAKLKNYFGDAAIAWIGKRGYSANPLTAKKIDALAAKDFTYSNLGKETGVSLTVNEIIWVKY